MTVLWVEEMVPSENRGCFVANSEVSATFSKLALRRVLLGLLSEAET